MWKIGECYLIRTVTYFVVGRLSDYDSHELAMDGASWVVDTGPFAEALSTGALRAHEPFPPGQTLVGRAAIVDACIWRHPLPAEQR